MKNKQIVPAVSLIIALSLVFGTLTSSLLLSVGIFGFPGIALAVSSGPNTGSTSANDSSVGTISWSNTSSAQSSNNSYATASLGSSQVTQYLKLTNFGFSIPVNATINGIVVNVEKSSSGTNKISDNSIKLVKNGSIGGDNKAISGDWPTADTVTTYGTTTDLWGQAWTPTDINASNTGVAISAAHDSTGGSRTAQIDYVSITVYYIVDTTAPSGGSITYTNGYYTTTSVSLTVSDGTDSESGINASSRTIQRKSATLSSGTCGSYGSWSAIAPSGSYPSYTDTTVTSGNCYQFQYLVSDNSGNAATYTSGNTVKIDTGLPSTTATYNGGALLGGWYTTSTVSVILSAADTVSGVATTYFRLDGAAITTYTGNFAITGDLAHSLLYWSTDGAGNAESANSATVQLDATPPTLSLPSDISAEATGAGGASVSYSFSANDLVSGTASSNCSPVSGSTFPLGTTTVNCSASDNAGNVSVGSFSVIIQDTTPPAISLAPDIALGATSSIGVAVSYTNPTATDLVDGSVSVSCVPASGSTFPIGTTTVTCTAADSRSNSAARNFNIIVSDTDAPILSLPSDIMAEATSPSGATVSFTASATDVVDGPLSVVCSPASGSTFPLGTTTVNCSASDNAGNVSVGSFAVAVSDTVAPTTPSLLSPANDVFIGSDPTVTWSPSTDGGTGISFYTLRVYQTSTSGSPLLIASTTGTSFPLSGYLPSDTSYYWEVGASDAAGNLGAFSAMRLFTRDTVSPTTPVVDIPGGDYNADQTVRLSSSDLNPNEIYYTLDSATPTSSSLVYNATSGIAVGVDTTLKAIAYDKAGNTSGVVIAIYGIAPVISAETTASVGTTSFVVSWNTDDPATSRVIFDTISRPVLGAAPNYGYANSTAEDSAKNTSHSVTVTGILADTTYYYRTVSRGSPETVSTEVSLTTKGESPRGSSGGAVYYPPVQETISPSPAPIELVSVPQTTTINPPASSQSAAGVALPSPTVPTALLSSPTPTVSELPAGGSESLAAAIAAPSLTAEESARLLEEIATTNRTPRGLGFFLASVLETLNQFQPYKTGNLNIDSFLTLFSIGALTVLGITGFQLLRNRKKV